jgi:DNA recombination protein RmuC
MDQTTNITITFIFAIITGALAAIVTHRLGRTGSESISRAADARIAEKEMAHAELRTEVSGLRIAAEKDRTEGANRIEVLQNQLREAVEVRAKLEGAGDSLEAIKGQLETKDKEIAVQAERITNLSSELARHKSSTEDASRAKDEAIAAKTAEVERLIQEKDASTVAQIADLKAFCERELAGKEESSDRALDALRAHCDEQLSEKEAHVLEQRHMLEQAEKKLTETFDSLSVKALTTVSEQFMKTAKATLETVQTEAKGDLKLKQQAIEEMLKPVSESLLKLQSQHEEMEKKRVSAFDAIEKGIQTISQETDHLANALRKPFTRGAWGEMNLKVILDNAGLTEGVHYDLQDSTEDHEGTRLRTDVIIHLPNGRDFIIDSKAPLESYWDGMNAADEATRLVKFAAHAKLVREHIKRLSTKSYWSRYKAAPDCVVMFVPTEGAYQAALEADPALLTDAHSGRIYLANPMTLVNMIHVTAYVLKEETLKQNAHEVQVTAAELYDRLSKFVGKFADLGRNLRITVSKYNEAVGSLDGRVLPQARKFNELGAGTKGDLPEALAVEIEPRFLTCQEARDSQEPELVLAGHSKGGSN